MKPTFKDIQVREFKHSDIELILEYRQKTPVEFWRSIGVNHLNMLSTEQFKQKYEGILNNDQNLDRFLLCIITYKNNPIGMHSISHHIAEKEGIMHAHIWLPELRGRGFGVFSYPKAMQFFMNNLNLNKIVFKTPKINISANRIKEKLGIKCLGEVLFDHAILIKPLESFLYEVDKKDLDCILQRLKKE